MRERAGDAVAHDAFAAAPPAPPIGLGDPARQHRAVGLELLPHDLEAQAVEPAERGQVRAREGNVEHVEVLQMEASELPSLRDLDPHPASDAPGLTHLHNGRHAAAPTPSFVKSRISRQGSASQLLSLMAWIMMGTGISRRR